ncbi:MAG: twin-arginine translocation signal domain-containing protein [Gallionella sp.]
MEENSRRSFFKKAAAAVGVVAAAGYAKTVISDAVESKESTSAKYAVDVAMQEKAVKENQLVVMTDEEKQQRLDDLLNFHRQETA